MRHKDKERTVLDKNLPEIQSEIFSTKDSKPGIFSTKMYQYLQKKHVTKKENHQSLSQSSS
jgi:hypothetical protein